MRNNESGTLTGQRKTNYTDNHSPDDSASAAARVAGKANLYEEEIARLRQGTVSNGLPLFEHHPDWVFAWVSSDPRMTGDNALRRLQEGWTLATKDLQPNLASAISASPDYHAASSGTAIKGAIQYRDVVAVMQPRQINDARMDYYHRQVVEERERALQQTGSQSVAPGAEITESQLKSARERRFNKIYDN